MESGSKRRQRKNKATDGRIYMENSPLVSVIIPVYNVEKYLRCCVDSVLAQTYTNLEIILIDDGSTDTSGKICDEYAQKDERIQVIHKANGGLSDARNKGLDICKGEYIAFVDSDDYLSKVFIEIVINAMKKEQCDLLAIKDGTPFWDGKVEPVLRNNIDDYHVEYCDARVALEKMLYQRIETAAQLKICYKSVYQNIRFPYGYLYEDLATTYKLFFYIDRVAILDENIYAYRKRRDSIVRQTFSEKKLVMLDIFDQLLNDEQIKKVGLEKAAASRVYAGLFSIFLQIPETDIELQKKVWHKLQSVQKIVLFDTSKYVRKKNRYAALASFLGMRRAYKLGRKFGQKGTMSK